MAYPTPVDFPQPKKIIGPTCLPELWDLLNLVKRDVMNTMNCVKIGKIESYVALTNTATVSINSKRKLTDGQEVEYPKLGDVPVFILCGSDSFISCPITKGDDCIVLFSDRSFDNWYLSGQVLPPSDIRSHSLSDGIAIVGIKSLKSTSLKPVNSLCINGGSKKVSIKNDSKDLKTQLNSLITNINSFIDTTKTIIDQTTATIDAIKLITVTCAGAGSPSGVPLNALSFDAMKTALTGYKTTLDTDKANLTTVNNNLNLLLDEGSI